MFQTTTTNDMPAPATNAVAADQPDGRLEREQRDLRRPEQPGPCGGPKRPARSQPERDEPACQLAEPGRGEDERPRAGAAERVAGDDRAEHHERPEHEHVPDRVLEHDDPHPRPRPELRPALGQLGDEAPLALGAAVVLGRVHRQQGAARSRRTCPASVASAAPGPASAITAPPTAGPSTPPDGVGDPEQGVRLLELRVRSRSAARGRSRPG